MGITKSLELSEQQKQNLKINSINENKTSENALFTGFSEAFIFLKTSHRTKSVPHREKMHYSYSLNHKRR